MRMEKTMSAGAGSIDLRPVDLMMRMATMLRSMSLGKNRRQRHSAMRSWVGKNDPSF